MGSTGRKPELHQSFGQEQADWLHNYGWNKSHSLLYKLGAVLRGKARIVRTSARERSK